MKAKYNREDDVLTIVLSPAERIDHAEESEGIIVHFSETDKPVLLEVLDASRLLASLTRIAVQAGSGELVPVE